MARKKKQEPPPLVNHRWNLPSVEQMLDDRLPEWPQGKHPDFSGPDGYRRMRQGFLKFAESIIRELSWHMGKAASKGIDEALALIQNPDYYETVKKRRSRSIQQGKQWREQQERDEKERERKKRGELSEAERIYELGNIAYHIHYHQAEIQKLEDRKRVVERVVPCSFEPLPEESPRVIHNNDDDEWADTIFDG